VNRLLTVAGAVAAAAAASLLPVACSSGSPQVVVGGNAQAGKVSITHYGCGSCHTIPGVKGATALVGPPLIHWSRRSFIAGKLANTPANLEYWVQDPQSVWPGNDMPNLGVTPTDARNIAAYLDGIG
jgi:cytochrome c1